ncbi:MAG: hypothetical protein COB04_14575 [Gammaproteobacteria bacterium]|nr:MAG: hypothetical protein COB04_14575 [Gammaproteobacteria bacterium]
MQTKKKTTFGEYSSARDLGLAFLKSPVPKAKPHEIPCKFNDLALRLQSNTKQGAKIMLLVHAVLTPSHNKTL